MLHSMKEMNSVLNWNKKVKDRFPMVVVSRPAICNHADTITHRIIPMIQTYFGANNDNTHS